MTPENSTVKEGLKRQLADNNYKELEKQHKVKTPFRVLPSQTPFPFPR